MVICETRFETIVRQDGLDGIVYFVEGVFDEPGVPRDRRVDVLPRKTTTIESVSFDESDEPIQIASITTGRLEWLSVPVRAKGFRPDLAGFNVYPQTGIGFTIRALEKGARLKIRLEGIELPSIDNGAKFPKELLDKMGRFRPKGIA